MINFETWTKKIREGNHFPLLIFLWLPIFILVLISSNETLLRLYEVYTPLPFWDMWSVTGISQRVLEEPLGFLAFFEPHSAHFIVIPKFIFFVNEAFLGASLVPLIVLNLLLSLTFWISFLVVSKFNKFEAGTLLIATILFGIITSGIQFENFFWSFQNQFFLVYLGAWICGLGYLGLIEKTQKKERRNTSLFLLIIGFLISLGSMGNGILLPVTLLFFSVLLKQSLRHQLIFLFLSILIIGTYLYSTRGSPANSSLNASMGFEEVIQIGRFSLMIIGNLFAYILPFKTFEFFHSSLIAGLVAVILAVIIGVIGLFKTDSDRFVLFKFSFLQLFILLSCLMIAYGRKEQGEITFIVSRYSTIALLFWGGLFCQAFIIFRTKFKLLFQIVVCVIGFFFILNLHSKQHNRFQHYSNMAERRSMETIPIRLGIHVDSILEMFLFDASVVKNLLALMEERGWYLFRDPLPAWFGDSLESHFNMSSMDTPILGRFEINEDIRSVVSNESYITTMASGWSYDPLTKKSASKILLTDREGIVVGFGRGNIWNRPDIAQFFETSHLANGWRAYVNSAEPINGPLRAWALRKKTNEIFPLEWEQEVQAVGAGFIRNIAEMTRFEKLPLEFDKLLIEGDFGEEGILGAAGPFPEAPKSYSSFQSGDYNQGQILFKGIEIAKADYLAVPILTGPSNAGLSITIRTGNMEETFVPEAQSGNWKIIQIPLDGMSERLLDLEISDQGTGSGQWIATSEPKLLRRKN